MKSAINTQIAFLCVIDILQSITTAQRLSDKTSGNLTESNIRKTFDNISCSTGETFSNIGVCLDEGYRVTDPPTSSVTKVYVDFSSQDILGMKDDENSIELFIEIVYAWEDNRIKIIPSYARDIGYMGFTFKGIDVPRPLTMRKRPPTWVPERLRFENITQSRKTVVPFTSLVLITGESMISMLYKGSIVSDPNTTVAVTITDWRMTVPCNFDHSMFPFDTHYCKFRVTNKDSRKIIPLLYPRMSTDKIMTLSKYGFTITGYLDEGINETNHSHVDLKFTMKRILPPFVFQYHLPSAAIVLVSQLSFIIPASAIPGRVGLLATLFLTLTNLFINHMVRLN